MGLGCVFGESCWPRWCAVEAVPRVPVSHAAGSRRRLECQGHLLTFLQAWENPSPGERLGKGLPNQPHFISTNTQGTYSMRSSVPYTSGDTSVKETVPALRRDTGAQGQHLKQATDVRADLWESQGLWIFRRGSCHLCRREVRLPDRGCDAPSERRQQTQPCWVAVQGACTWGCGRGRILGPSIYPLSLTFLFM